MQRKATIYYYISLTGDNPVKDFLDSLSVKQQTKVLRIFQLIQVYGLDSVIPHIRKFSGTPLWEIRILGKDNIRIIYVAPGKTQVIALHGFVKKTNKTPPKEIRAAFNRWADWKSRYDLLT